jgi:hypothetical protein
MNFIKSIILSFALISTSFAEPIKDMFGVSFGDKFDVTKGIKVKTPFRDDSDVYQFVPSIPYRAFVTYYVMITPKTHIIYGIYAKSRSELDSQLLIDEEKLIKIITYKKYGIEAAFIITNVEFAFSKRVVKEPEKNKIQDEYDKMREEIQQRYRDLTSYSVEYTLKLVYRDGIFKEQAHRERDELVIEAAKVDFSGL